jgi:hypothetical protein
MPEDTPKLLTPAESSVYLWERYRIRRGERRLAQLRATGEGPAYHRVGVVVRHTPQQLDAWAQALVGTPVSSTNEETARRDAVEMAADVPA